MELDELETRLGPFVRAKYGDPAALVSEVHKMPGHAGFAYGFTAESRGARESWFLRIPPPNVQWRGTADVLRQVCALRALDGSDVPHCPVRWSGDELEWFGCPYFVVPKLEGDVLRLGPSDWGAKLSAQTLRSAAEQAMCALAGIHRVAWREKCAYLGDPVPFAEDVERWDRFLPKLAEPERFALRPRVRERLLAKLPEGAPIGLFHGDFQVANLFFSFAGELLAVIDWELVGIGATLNDVGWIATFNSKAAWDETRGSMVPNAGFPSGDELVAMYQDAWGARLPDVAWFRALAAYKFAIISGFNLGLHRRGKRHDPLWEITALSIAPLLEHAAELLG
jgi:aminoglycoside phosphotransferase (APT) family kinase protein